MFKNLVTATESVDVNLTDSDMTSISTEVLNTLLNNQMASDPQADAYFGLKSDLMSAKNLLSILSETSDPTSVLAVANGAGDISTISPAYESFLQGTTALTPNLDAVKGELSAAIAAGDVALEGFWKNIGKKLPDIIFSLIIVLKTAAAAIAMMFFGLPGMIISGGLLVSIIATATIYDYSKKCKVAKSKLKAEDDARLKEIERIESLLGSIGSAAYIELDVHPAEELLIMINDCTATSHALKLLMGVGLPIVPNGIADFWGEVDGCGDDLRLSDFNYAGFSIDDDYLMPPKKSGDMKQLGYDKHIEEIIKDTRSMKQVLESETDKKYVTDIKKMLKLEKPDAKLIREDMLNNGYDEDDIAEGTADLQDSYVEYVDFIERFIKASSKLLTETTRQLKLIDDTWVVKIEDPMGILK